MTNRTDDATLVSALRILAREVQSGDGVANACIEEAAERLHDLTRQIVTNHETAEAIIANREATIARLKEKIGRLSVALRDAISTYDPNKAMTFVSAERQEAWIEALNH